MNKDGEESKESKGDKVGKKDAKKSGSKGDSKHDKPHKGDHAKKHSKGADDVDNNGPESVEPASDNGKASADAHPTADGKGGKPYADDSEEDGGIEHPNAPMNRKKHHKHHKHTSTTYKNEMDNFRKIHALDRMDKLFPPRDGNYYPQERIPAQHPQQGSVPLTQEQEQHLALRSKRMHHRGQRRHHHHNHEENNGLV